MLSSSAPIALRNLVAMLTLVLVTACGDSDDERPPTWRGLAVGELCEGEGECGQGVVEKKAGGGAMCSTMPGGTAAEDTTETCDDLDNDCDGRTDDLPDAPNADQQAGVCSGALKACLPAGGWEEPDYSTIAGYETDETTCDELDNDCDGITDEGCPNCGAMDSKGLFPNCDSCPAGDCDQISGPLASGYACGCSGGCPCGLSCGSITIATNVTVTACTR